MTKAPSSNQIKIFLFLAGMLLFYADFLRIQLFDRNQILYISGFDFLFGTTVYQHNHYRNNVSVDLYLCSLFTLHAIGLIFCLMDYKHKKKAHLIISISGIIMLILFQLKYLFTYRFTAIIVGETDFCIGYWLAIVILLLIGSFSYIRINQKKETKREEKTIININIITNSNNKET